MYAIVLREFLEATLRLFSTKPFISAAELDAADIKSPELHAIFWGIEWKKDNILTELMTTELMINCDHTFKDKLLTESKTTPDNFLSNDPAFLEKFDEYYAGCRLHLAEIADMRETRLPHILTKFDYLYRYQRATKGIPYPIFTNSLISALPSFYSRAESALSEVSMQNPYTL
jgi:hypothetical protein